LTSKKTVWTSTIYPRVGTIPPAIEQINSILSDFKLFFEDCSASPPAVPIPIPLAWCTPKVKALTEVLLAYHTPAFHGIVFVEQHQVAACLAKVLSKIPELRGRIRCAELVGHGDGHGTRGKGGSNGNVALGVNLKGMGLARQQDTVKSFRKSYEEGGLNLRKRFFAMLPACHIVDSLCPVIASSVAEEGLDFPVCLPSSVACDEFLILDR
jgi:endoribonuclease Dicer